MAIPVLLWAFVLLFFISQYFKFNVAETLLIYTLMFVPLMIIPAARDKLGLIYLENKGYHPGFFLLFSLLIFLPLLIKMYRVPGMGMGKDAIRRPPGQEGGKTAILTFDDGPSPLWTEKILEVLKENKVPAIFFVVGKSAREHPAIIEKLQEAGMEIAVHTDDHLMLPFLFPGQIKNQLDNALEALDSLGCPKPRFFRPPWGMHNRQVLEMAKERGLATMLWSKSSMDWAGIPAPAIEKNALSNLDDGEIFLFHDGHRTGLSREATLKALPEIIRQLKEKGYEFPPIK